MLCLQTSLKITARFSGWSLEHGGPCPATCWVSCGLLLGSIWNANFARIFKAPFLEVQRFFQLSSLQRLADTVFYSSCCSVARVHRAVTAWTLGKLLGVRGDAFIFFLVIYFVYKIQPSSFLTSLALWCAPLVEWVEWIWINLRPVLVPVYKRQRIQFCSDQPGELPARLSGSQRTSYDTIARSKKWYLLMFLWISAARTKQTWEQRIQNLIWLHNSPSKLEMQMLFGVLRAKTSQRSFSCQTLSVWMRSSFWLTRSSWPPGALASWWPSFSLLSSRATAANWETWVNSLSWFVLSILCMWLQIVVAAWEPRFIYFSWWPQNFCFSRRSATSQ